MGAQWFVPFVLALFCVLFVCFLFPAAHFALRGVPSADVFGSDFCLACNLLIVRWVTKCAVLASETARFA